MVNDVRSFGNLLGPRSDRRERWKELYCAYLGVYRRSAIEEIMKE